MLSEFLAFVCCEEWLQREKDVGVPDSPFPRTAIVVERDMDREGVALETLGYPVMAVDMWPQNRDLEIAEQQIESDETRSGLLRNNIQGDTDDWQQGGIESQTIESQQLDASHGETGKS